MLRHSPSALDGEDWTVTDGWTDSSQPPTPRPPREFQTAVNEQQVISSSFQQADKYSSPGARNLSAAASTPRGVLSTGHAAAAQQGCNDTVLLVRCTGTGRGLFCLMI